MCVYIRGYIRGPPWHYKYPSISSKNPDTPENLSEYLSLLKFDPTPVQITFATRGDSSKSLVAIAWENGKITLLNFIPNTSRPYS